MDENKLDLVRGSLIGGAIGDALGYPVEFMSYRHILEKYGEPGITRYELRYGRAEISDDTQMTLFTAAGILKGLARFLIRGIANAPHYYVEYAYYDWYFTQSKTMEERLNNFNIVNDSKMPIIRHTWLSEIPELYARRSPGTTCLKAISEMINERTPQNNSKGCGGIMRVSPWPLICGTHTIRYSVEEVDVAGGEIARLTHKHPLGWMPAILLTDIIYHLVKDIPLEGLTGRNAQLRFFELVQRSLDSFKGLKTTEPISDISWGKDELIVDVFKEDWIILQNLVSKALQLALDSEGSDEENIRQLGEGWVAEETLAIAIYAVARHIDSFENVIIAAVNHDGDSDSTGSVAGNMIGAIVGYEAIPYYYKTDLELHDVILAIADDLYQDCIISSNDYQSTPRKRQWYERYVMSRPAL